MHRYLLAVTAFAGALIPGCGDQQDLAMSPTTDPLGSSVERVTTPLPPGVILDFAESLTIQLGATFQTLVSFCPGLIPPTQDIDQLTVTRPDGSTKLQWKGEEVDVVVWEALGNPCDLLDVPHFTGTARLVVNDSDLDLSGSGADAAQVHLEGTVTDASGQLYHLVAFVQTVVGAEFTSPDNFEFRHFIAKIKLTPIGG